MTSFIGRQELRSGSAELLLVDDDGVILLSTLEQAAATPRTKVHRGTPRPRELAEYANTQGVDVVGILAPMSGFSWGLVMEKRQDQVLSEVIGLRNQTLLGVALLITLFGAFAYRISRGIIAPLERLTDAAGRVADGDLDIKVPVERRDELGEATEVFNDMVGQLKQSRDRLEQLSTTDSLTQLANRKHVMEKLRMHLERFRRSGTCFSVLLIDADHFKRINDTAGHLVGDRVLRQLGDTLRRLLRTVDVAGRYGGEEFLIILDETMGKEALQTAERIRRAIASNEVDRAAPGIPFTVSIGVAEIGSGEAEDQLIMRADTALYQAKAEGRNRSVLAKAPNANVTHHPATRKKDHS
jgi:diguanylate cyclase (GGDEF)-like protein